MTVSVQQPFTASVASGATTVFPYGFKVAHADDLSVSLDGVLQTTGYSVTGVGDDAGGDVVFDAAPAAGVKVLRYLDPVLNRQTDYQQFGDWTAAVVNLDFDRLWLAIQAISQNTSRSLKLPVDTADNQEITADAAARANKGIRFDADGNLVISLYDPDASGSYADAAYSYAETAEAAQAGAVNAKEDAEISAAEAAASAASVNAANLLTKAGNLSGLVSASTARSNLGVAIGSDVQAYDADIATVAASASEMQIAMEAALRSMSPFRVGQAVMALSPPAGWSAEIPLSGQAYVEQTGIPDWVKAVFVVIKQASPSATVTPLVQIGSASTLTTSGYDSVSSVVSTTPAVSSRTDGFHVFSGNAAYASTDVFLIAKANESESSTTCVCVHAGMTTNGSAPFGEVGGGSAATSSGKLSTVRLSVSSGTFDRGTVTFIWI